MNVFRHELHGRLRALTLWSLAMVVFLMLCMAKFQTIISSGGATIQAMLKGFPQSVQALYGMAGLDLTTVSGYYGVCFLFVVVILAVYSGLLGGGLIAREESTHTTEFLYVKPRSRSNILIAKLVVGVINLFVMWLVVVVGSVLAIMKFAAMDGFWHDLLRLMVAAGIIQIVFFSLGVASAVLARRSMNYAKVVAIAIVVSYLLYVFSKLSDSIKWLHYGSIFSYFDAVDIINAHQLKLHYILVCLVVSLAFIGVAFWRYRRCDFSI